MWKRGLYNTTWKRRYFCLWNGAILYYFKNDKEYKNFFRSSLLEDKNAKSKGLIDLTEVTSCCKLANVRVGTKAADSLCIVTPTRQWILEVENQETVDSWLTILEKCTAEHRLMKGTGTIVVSNLDHAVRASVTSPPGLSKSVVNHTHNYDSILIPEDDSLITRNRSKTNATDKNSGTPKEGAVSPNEDRDFRFPGHYGLTSGLKRPSILSYTTATTTSGSSLKVATHVGGTDMYNSDSDASVKERDNVPPSPQGSVSRTPFQKFKDAVKATSPKKGSWPKAATALQTRIFSIPAAMIPTSTEVIIHRGYLFKLGELLRKWKVRYFVLHGDYLFYYESEEKYMENSSSVIVSPSGFISIEDILNVSSTSPEKAGLTLPTAEKHVYKPNYQIITIETSNRNYFLHCGNEVEHQEWMDALNITTGKCRVHSNSITSVLSTRDRKTSTNRNIYVEPTRQLAGILMKSSRNDTFKTWRERYFIFENYQINYYKSKKEMDYVRGSFKITKTAKVTTMFPSSRKHCFNVSDEGESDLLMQATSEAEMKEWVTCLQGAIDRLKFLDATSNNTEVKSSPRVSEINIEYQHLFMTSVYYYQYCYTRLLYILLTYL